MKAMLAVMMVVGVQFPLSDWDFHKIGRLNSFKEEAQEAYLNQNYNKAAYFLRNAKAEEPSEGVILNLAHALHLQDDTTSIAEYQTASSMNNPSVSAVAYNQLGIITAERAEPNSITELEDAAENFKNALRQNPDDEEIRYNYELVKRMIANVASMGNSQENQQNAPGNPQAKGDEMPQEEQNNTNKEQNKDNNSQDQNQNGDSSGSKQNQEATEPENKEGNHKSEEEKQAERGGKQHGKEKEGDAQQTESAAQEYQKHSVSPEKALMILDAMKNNEIQYIQQLKRKTAKSQNKKLPDW